MSYANLAGLPYVFGLYGGFVPCLFCERAALHRCPCCHRLTLMLLPPNPAAAAAAAP